MTNILRRECFVPLMKPVIVCRVPDHADKGVPFFTEPELKWMREEVLEQEHLEFLYRARADNPDYQVMPEPAFPPLAPAPAVSPARQEFFDFVFKSKRAGQ